MFLAMMFPRSDVQSMFPWINMLKSPAYSYSQLILYSLKPTPSNLQARQFTLDTDISTVAEQIVTIQTAFETAISLYCNLNCEDSPDQSLTLDSIGPW